MKKKKVLLITAFFYPQNRIPVLRLGQWAKYWDKHNYEVTVLTTKKYDFVGPFGLDVDIPETIKIIEVDYLPNFLKKILKTNLEGNKNNEINSKNNERDLSFSSKIKMFIRGFRSKIGSLIDIHDLWINKAFKIAEGLLKKNKFDIIVSSYSPAATHSISKKIKKEFKDVIWIADFRDLWAYNHLQSAKGLLGKFEKYKEKKTLKNADLLVTVSNYLTKEMKSIYPDKNIITIENGFDEEEFPNWRKEINKKKIITNKLNITYAGTIYPEKRDPEPLFIALNELIEEDVIKKENVSLNFYGNNKVELLKIIAKSDYNKYSIIKLKGFVNREESLKMQKESDLLLFLEWNDSSAKGVLTGKLFEYMVSGVPVLAIGIDTDNEAGELIEKSGIGKTLLKSDEIKAVLKNIIISKKIPFYIPNEKIIEVYSREKQALNLFKGIE